MSLVKVLFISAFFNLSLSPPHRPSVDESCDGLSVKSTISQVESQGARAEIEASGGQAPYHYLFYKPSGHLLNEEFNKSSVNSLQKGKYFCTVIDKKGCYKTIEFEIK